MNFVGCVDCAVLNPNVSKELNLQINSSFFIDDVHKLEFYSHSNVYNLDVTYTLALTWRPKIIQVLGFKK